MRFTPSNNNINNNNLRLQPSSAIEGTKTQRSFSFVRFDWILSFFSSAALFRFFSIHKELLNWCGPCPVPPVCLPPCPTISICCLWGLLRGTEKPLLINSFGCCCFRLFACSRSLQFQVHSENFEEEWRIILLYSQIYRRRRRTCFPSSKLLTIEINLR